jgi:hypothetical protein
VACQLKPLGLFSVTWGFEHSTADGDKIYRAKAEIEAAPDNQKQALII